MAEVICSVIFSQGASVQGLTTTPTTRPTLGPLMPTGRSNQDREETWLEKVWGKCTFKNYTFLSLF